jgi:hypothetical protein
MKRSVYLKGVSLIIFIAVFISCSTIDINNEQAVMKDIQGAWIGYENTGNMYRHVKLSIDKDSFEGWVQTSDSQSEPIWTDLPGENGLISLSSLQEDPNGDLKFRKFAFTCSGRCCGDKSLSLQALSNLITYDEGKGLILGGKVKMTKK